MPAWPAERAEALDAGVHFLLLCQPIRYLTDDAGRLCGVVVARTDLGAPDSSGRRRPIVQADGEFVLKLDLAIEAIGERLDPRLAAALDGVELTEAGLVKVDPRTLATTRTGVWAAGDLVNGGATVVEAVADGRRAAEEIDVFLAGDVSHRP